MNISLLREGLKTPPNIWEESVVSIANSEGFLGSWVFVLGCWKLFWCWIFWMGGGGFLSKLKTGRLGIELLLMILTLKIWLDTKFSQEAE